MATPNAGVRTQAGAFARPSSGGITLPWILNDAAPTSQPLANRTLGQARAAQLQIRPTVMQRFSLLGFSVQLHMSANLNTLAAVTPIWARWGDVWAGLYVNTPLPPTDSPFSYTTGPAFPPDLSTFTKIWDGREGDVAVTNSNSPPASLTPNIFTLIADNFMLPAPVDVDPSSQLGFGLIMMPSMVSQFFSGGIAGLTIWDCSYSVLYQVESVDYGR